MEFLSDYNILPVAFSPLSRLPLLGENDKALAFRNINQKAKDIREAPALQKLAQKYGKTVAQVSLRWGIDRGVCVIPKSKNIERQKENISIFDFKLEKSEIDEVN